MSLTLSHMIQHDHCVNTFDKQTWTLKTIDNI